MKRLPRTAYAPGVVLLALCVPGWLIDHTLFWAAYLAAWWFCIGTAMGALASVWIHNMTGGAWGAAIREPSLSMARAVPLLALLFIPVLFGMRELYSWAGAGVGAGGIARFSAEVSSPGFKSAWLTPWFFVVRSIVYLAIWVALEWITRTARFNRSKPWSAAALIIYWVSASLAAMDWLMSLMPLWYSTAFAPLIVTGQMLSGFAAAVLAVAIRAQAPRSVFRDFGNLLLVYVLSWAYLAFTQYLIIWAENLPHEIAWYVARLHSHWYWIGWLLVTCHFFIPLLVLLSRSAKEAPLILGSLAAGLLVLHLIDAWWLIVPSVRPASAHVLWLAPLAALGMVALAAAALALVIVLVVAGVHLLASSWNAPLEGPNAPLRMRIEGPVLQSAPQDERARYFREKEVLLERYEWIDRAHGIARIPIDAAIQLLARQHAQDARPGAAQ